MLETGLVWTPMVAALFVGGGASDLRVATATPAPLVATSPSGDLSVVLVPGVDTTGAGTGAGATTGALVAKTGEFVQWVELATHRFPDALFALDDRTLHCVVASETGSPALVGFNTGGQLIAYASLDDLVNSPAETIELATVTVVGAADEPRLALELGCGTLAFLECGPVVTAPDRAAGPDGAAGIPEYRVCSTIPSPKHACGVASWLEQARILERNGDADAAQFALEAAVETDSSDPSAHRALARFHDRHGDTDARIGCLRSATESVHASAEGAVSMAWRIGTPEAQLSCAYADAVRDAGDPQALLAALDQVQLLYPCMKQSVLMRAEALLDAEQQDRAIEHIHSALIELDPNDDLAAAYGDVARFFGRHGMEATSLRYYEDAYALGDRSEFLLRSLADVSVSMGDIGRGIEWLLVLENVWRTTVNGESEPSRRARALDRMNDLEDEISALELRRNDSR